MADGWRIPANFLRNSLYPPSHAGITASVQWKYLGGNESFLERDIKTAYVLRMRSEALVRVKMNNMYIEVLIPY